MTEDDWWRLDGTVEWTVNPSGQTVELGLDSEGWTVSVSTPLMPRRPMFVMRSVCRHEARRLYETLAVLEAPGPSRALQKWRRARARKDHPAGGD